MLPAKMAATFSRPQCIKLYLLSAPGALHKQEMFATNHHFYLVITNSDFWHYCNIDSCSLWILRQLFGVFFAEKCCLQQQIKESNNECHISICNPHCKHWRYQHDRNRCISLTNLWWNQRDFIEWVQLWIINNVVTFISTCILPAINSIYCGALTHCGPVMSYDDIEQDQHRPR